MNKENDLILVDLDDRETGYGEKMDVHRKGLLHRAFSVFLFHENRLLIQQRALEKYHCGGLWANTCCSHPHPEQSLPDTAQQRLMDECGISGVSLHEAGCFVYRAVFPNGLTEFEVDHVLVGEYSGTLSPNPEEIAELRYVHLEELKKNMILEPGKYAPWFFTALGIAEAGRI